MALEKVMLISAVLVLAAVLSVRLATRTGLPSLLLFLALGVLLGDSGLGVQLDDYDLARDLSFAALAVIIGEGGITTRWDRTRPIIGLATALATVGIALSVVVVAAGCHFLLDFDLRTSLLMGAVVASTDAAAVFSVMRRMPLRGNTGAVLEAESALNDPPVVILVTVIASTAWEERDWLAASLDFLLQVGMGVAVGVVVGWVAVQTLNRARLPSSGLYPIAAFSFVLASFGLAVIVHGSGFVAVFLTGIILGNSSIPNRSVTVAFAEAGAALAQIGLFVMLGLLASTESLLDVLWPALLVGGVLTFVARPVSVVLSAWPFGVRDWRVLAFMSWAGLRGAVPIAAATIPISEGIDGGQKIFDIVFLLVVVYTVVQAPPLPWLATRLGLSRAGSPREVDVESAPLDELRADLLQFTIPDGSNMHGVYVDELLLPADAHVTLVVRGGRAHTPGRDFRLMRGDQVLVVATRAVRAVTERRLQAVSDHGRLAQWRGATEDDEDE